MKAATTITLNRKTIALSHLDKVFYHEAAFTKGDVINYYIQIAPVLLPHLRNRPLTLKRYPEGVGGEFFYEKRCPTYRPPWMKTAKVWSSANQENIFYCVVQDVASLVWAANLANLEVHTSLARMPNVDRPTMVMFDLDPGPGADILDCAQVALWLRELLGESALKCFPKTSGSKGLQLCVPLNTIANYGETKSFARNVAEQMARKYPDRVVSQMAKTLRKDKVFIDWSQNDRHKTTVCVYSLRAKERPTVSTPVSWRELQAALTARSAAKLTFEAPEALKRVRKSGDLFKPLLELKQKLPKLA